MRYYGVDPNGLTMWQYHGYLDRLIDVSEWETGHADNRDLAERMFRRREAGDY